MDVGNDVVPESWTSKNQKYLLARMEQVKGYMTGCPPGSAESKQQLAPLWDDEQQPPALERLCRMFGLSDFERMVLVLCAAEELDSEVSKLCAQMNGGSAEAAYPSFSIALAAFPDPHWSALSPAAPLRLFRLVTPLGLPQVPLTRCQLRIEERVLHYLTGISYLDKAIHGIVEPVRNDAPIVESQNIPAEIILHAWKSTRPLRAQLVGPDDASKNATADIVCKRVGLTLWQISGDLIPQRPDELESFAQLWDRESALLGAALYVHATELEPAAEKSVRRFLATIAGPAFLSTTQQWQQEGSIPYVEVAKPTKKEQRLLWESLLGEGEEGDHDKFRSAIGRVINQFDLGAGSIQSAVSDAVLAKSGGSAPDKALWSAGRKVARPSLSHLAQRIVAKATMDDLVLGDREKELLRSIIASTRQRFRVYEEWGFAHASDRGLGISALFAGDSGTGKTMAAEAIAHELDLDLYKIDLSMVVNKYIGETEKNLRKIFDAAEDGGAILLFDEADALFGKRGEVKEGLDRYANIEVGYLLQRMESYRGLAILTTNLKNSLDKAFTRRLRSVVNFSFPDEKSRVQIWKKVFPPTLPLDSLDYARLGSLELAGGNIRNIALGASFLAADEDLPVSMIHIARAAREEFERMGRPFPAGRIVPA
jgi:AAA+ superfamily predicted ATPase